LKLDKVIVRSAVKSN